MNQALWRMNAFQHQPPEFRYFDPVLSEQLEVEMKEVRLPFSDQTHEMCYEPVSRCLFISQMSNSVLVRIPVGANGMLLDDQDAWRVGPVDKDRGDGISGLHNLSLSPANPGCLWLSLQSANTILLVEGATMKVRKVMKVPTMLVRKDKTAVLVGGPHCVRECPRTGNVWVALKGSQGCHPGHVPGVAELSGKRGFALAKERVCCDAKALRKRMDTLAGLGYDSPPPEGYASTTPPIPSAAALFTRRSRALLWWQLITKPTAGLRRIRRRPSCEYTSRNHPPMRAVRWKFHIRT